jgi:hypothetical protein
MITFLKKKWLYALLVMLGAILIPTAAQALDLNFDNYSIDNLTGQGSWIAYGAYDSCWVNNLVAESGTKSAGGVYLCANKHTAIPITSTTGYLEFFFQATSSFSGKQAWICFGNSCVSQTKAISIESTEIYLYGGTHVYEGVFTLNIWHRILLEYNFTTDLIRASYDWSNFTDWVAYTGDGSDILVISVEGGGETFWFDSFTTVPDCTSACSGCSYAECGYYDEVCAWNWPSGACEPIPEVNACGPTWLCGFCTNETTCETANCFWYYGYCWQFEQITQTTSTSFWLYYEEHASYASPTDFVLNLASSTSPLFDTINQWLTSFGQSMNPGQASQMGSSTGSVIPRLRGYFGVLNPIFNDFPLGDFILLILFAFCAVIVIRVVRAFWHLVKVW